MGSPAVIERMLFGLGFRDFGVMYLASAKNTSSGRKVSVTHTNVH